MRSTAHLEQRCAAEPIGVAALGYVGLTVALGFAQLGHPVVAMDFDESRVRAFADGRLQLHEPGMAALLAANRDRVFFTTDP